MYLLGSLTALHVDLVAVVPRPTRSDMRAGYRGSPSWSGRGAQPRWWHDLALLVVVVAAVGVGGWLGEDASLAPPRAVALLTGGVVVAALIGRAAAPNIVRGRRGAMVAAAAFGLAFWAGTREVQSSLSDCVERGEEFRNELARYRASTGDYPVRLQNLAPSAIASACPRLIRGTILKYERTQGGYRLTYDDWTATHQATESAPFAAYR
ncbi:MAG: hypothetical protein NVS4B3_08010 [Gemmatimonadaceae bacterium]